MNISHGGHRVDERNRSQHRIGIEHNNHKEHAKPNITHNHHDMMIGDFKRRFYISLVATLPVLLLDPMIQQWLAIALNIPGSSYVSFAISSFVYFYGGWPFLTGFIDEIKIKSPGMMTLISLAITVAYAYSSGVVFGLPGNVFFWELATLIDIMLLGHWIEMKSVLSASRALEKLSELMPDEAHVIRGSNIIDIKVDELSKGDRLLIKPGEKVPIDGIIAKGKSYVNEAMLTGESKPVEKRDGDKLIGGSINGDGSLEITIENLGEETYLTKVISLVKEAQQTKSKTQHLADKAAFWLTIVALVTGFGTLFAWLYLGRSLGFAIERMATVMIIACPHALGLAVPLVVAYSTALSAKKGLLVRNRTAFENARKISVVVFDKTGTLTEGIFGVNSIHLYDNSYDEKKIIQLAASLEKNSEHPIATGILEKAKSLEVNTVEASGFEAIKGKGVKGTIDEKQIMVVSPGYLKENNIDIPQHMGEEISTTVYLLVNNTLVASISLSDKIRQESKDAVKLLRKSGIKVWMLTGDNSKIAEKVSGELGLDGYFAEVLPHQKQEKIKELQYKGEFVAMTGDGVNDAPALAQADVGIAIGSGTDVAAETADIILVNSNPEDVNNLIVFGRATYKKMIQNLIWATGYNAFAIPLASGILYNAGIVISPAIGAVFMSLSTVIVAINAKMLKF